MALCGSTAAQLPRSDFPAYPPGWTQWQSSHHFNSARKLKEGRDGVQHLPETAAVLGAEEKRVRVQRLKSTPDARHLRDALSISEHGFEGL